MQLFKIVSLSTLVTFAFGKMDFYIDDTVKLCTKKGEAAEAIDISQFELIATSDTEMMINGSVKFLKGFEEPWRVIFHTEKFERGQWNALAYQRRMDDLCKNIHGPTEIWYQYAKVLKGCPLKAGVIFFKYFLIRFP